MHKECYKSLLVVDKDFPSSYSVKRRTKLAITATVDNLTTEVEKEYVPHTEKCYAQNGL